MPKRNIRISLAYDGTDFLGWQVQKEGRTVQGAIEAALRALHQYPVKVRGAGRTDSGVHASNQVANFHTELDSIPDRKFREALNTHLPPDVRVLDSRAVAPSFDAQKDALRRIYRYQLYVAEVGLPHHRRYCWKIRHKPDLAILNRIASMLVGEHDFTTFAAAGDSSLSKVRRVYSAAFYPQAPFLVFRIVASSFLWKMVRSVLGTILFLEQGGSDPAAMEQFLQARDRSLVGNTAPARGLFLDRIIYEENHRPG